MKVLLTSTSFQDTEGSHHDLFNQQGYDTDYLRGPISEAELLEIIDNYDALLCGDDELTRKVLVKGKSGKLKFISKYGVGLDKIDLIAAKELGIPVTNCPNVNQVSVAEHVFALLLTYCKNIHLEYNITRSGNWFRHVGSEVFGKTIGIIGLGAIGKEVALRAHAFGLKVVVFDLQIDNDFVERYKLDCALTLVDLVKKSDFISLHVPLNNKTFAIINRDLIKSFKSGCVLINTARGNLVNLTDLIWGLDNKLIRAYLADVLDIEPMPHDYVLSKLDNVLITPHIGSRTFESVEKQGVMAVTNLVNMISKSNG